MINILVLMLVFNITMLSITPLMSQLFKYLEIIKNKQALILELRYIKNKRCAGFDYEGPLTIITVVNHSHFTYVPKNLAYPQIDLICFKNK